MNARKLGKSMGKSEAVPMSIPIPAFSYFSGNNTILTQSCRPIKCRFGWFRTDGGDVNLAAVAIKRASPEQERASPEQERASPEQERASPEQATRANAYMI
ncbi:hypothetical protein DINM_003419 [Dirofilaria immitis]|nr:hypothetical protein [Dirofilaria immitis]